MRVWQLINELKKLSPNMDVRIDAVFNVEQASQPRVICEKDGVVVIRDYFTLQNGDLVIKIKDQEYVAVR